MNAKEGEPGKKGEQAIGQQGGKGGEGGRGGKGTPVGKGGAGGEGGRGAQGRQGPQGPRGEAGKYEAIHPYRWAALGVWIIVFTLATGYALRETREQAVSQEALSVENKQRIADIQQSRIDSCKANYESIREVFFVLVGRPTDRRTRRRAVRFNEYIDQKKMGCVAQTDPDTNGGS